MTRRRTHDSAAWICLLVPCFTACADTTPPEAAEAAAGAAVATYRDGTVARGELESWQRFRESDRAESDLEAEVGSMLLTRTLAAAARERGTDREPAMRVALRQAADTPLARAYKRHAGEQIEVADEEVETLLRQKPDAFHRPRKVRLRNLYKRFPDGAGKAEIEDLRAEMAALEKQLRAGADFAELARHESDSQSRFQGGLIGNVEAGRLRPEIDAVAMSMEPGQISPVIETEEGLTILACDRIFEAKVPTREEALTKIRGNLQRLRSRQRLQALEKEILAAAAPHYDFDAAHRPEAPTSVVVLRFQGGELARSELPGLLRSRRRGPDPAAYSPQQLRNLLEQYVVQVEAAARARSLGLSDDPELGERTRWSQLQILAAAEMSHRVQTQLVAPTAEEIRTYYETHPESFERLPYFDLATIHFTLDPQNPRPRYRQAEEVLARIRSGAIDFAAAARAHSDHPSAAEGGALGWLSKRQLSRFGRVTWEMIPELEARQVSELIQRDQDLWIFQLRGVQPPRPMTLDEATAAAEKTVGTERTRKIVAKIEEQVLEDLQVRLVTTP